MKYCTKCGQPMDEKEGFCSHCGTQAGQPTYAQPAYQNQGPEYTNNSVFKEYLAMFKNYANFTDRTTVRGYWMAILWNFVAGILVSILTMALGFVGAALSYIYSLAILCPSWAITIRRLRDAGKHWAMIFVVFIPIGGPIWLIVMLCGASVPADYRKVV